MTSKWASERWALLAGATTRKVFRRIVRDSDDPLGEHFISRLEQVHAAAATHRWEALAGFWQ
jgi:hypothetical protein